MNNVEPDYDLLAKIKSHFEGYSIMAYKDSGNVWTIGAGHTYNYDKDRKVKSGDIISMETNTRWTKIAVAEIVANANRYIKRPLNLYQSTAIVDYIYNRGIGNFLKTRLDELINTCQDIECNRLVAKEILNTGLKDKLGNLLWGLGRRRRAQAHLYITGTLKFDWPRWGTFKL